MLLKTFKSNYTANFFIFPIIVICFWGKELISPKAYKFFEGENENCLFIPIYNLLEKYPIIQCITALVLVILMGFLLLQINNRYNVIRIRTMLPALLYMLIVSGVSGLHVLHPVYFAALFFLFSIYRLFSAFDRVKPYSAAFDAGLLLSIASLFYFNMMAFVPVLLIAIGLLSRETGWREFCIVIVGYIIPYLFVFSFAFYYDRIQEFLTVIEQNIYTNVNYKEQNKIMIFYSSVVLFFIVLGSIKIIAQYNTKKVSTRKYYIIFFLLFISSMAALVFVPAVSYEIIVISAIPVTFLVTNYFVFLKSKFWSEFLFALLLVVMVVIQFI